MKIHVIAILIKNIYFFKNIFLKPQIKLFFSHLSFQTTTMKVTAKPNLA
jgi:hypothetical protein